MKTETGKDHELSAEEKTARLISDVERVKESLRTLSEPRS